MKLASVVEAPADHRLVRELVTAVLIDEVEWLEAEIIDESVAWIGPSGSSDHHVWRRWRAETRRFRPRGRFAKDGAVGYELPARSYLIHLAQRVGLGEPLDGVVLMVDSDGDMSRLGELQAARDRREGAWPFAVVCGVPHTKRECWVLLGFVAENRHEEAALAALRERLPFDPITHPERLTHTAVDGERSAKRALSELTGGDFAREERCVATLVTRLAALSDVTSDPTGVARFTDEIRTELAPVLDGIARH